MRETAGRGNPGRQPSTGSPWYRRAFHLCVASACVTLGIAGAILPGLPATPFLLLASYCLAQSSPRLNERLHRCCFIGQILHDWQQQRGVQRVAKAQAIGTIIFCVMVTIAFSSLSAIALAFIVVAASGGVLVICLLPVAKPSATAERHLPPGKEDVPPASQAAIASVCSESAPRAVSSGAPRRTHLIRRDPVHLPVSHSVREAQSGRVRSDPVDSSWPG
jgi:uncharacterized membrane protein YbaN (DUF454 family)